MLSAASSSDAQPKKVRAQKSLFSDDSESDSENSEDSDDQSESSKKRSSDDQGEENDGMHRYDVRLRQVSAALRSVEPPGSFATTGSYAVYPFPVIKTEGTGQVCLPLTDATAKELIAQCHLAPYGLREQTLVDTSVRNTWELNTTQFKIDNPAWQPFVDGIVEAIHVPLGLPASTTVAAKLYKLLLYEAGGKFDQHQDSEKERGMFGTLVVVLPGVFTGGELVVHDPSTASDHGKAEAMMDDESQQLVWDAGAMDPFVIKYAAFYGDCPHEVLPVKSGYRLCLTYNLVTVVDEASTAAATEPTFNQNHALYASLKTALGEYFTDVVADHKPTTAKRGEKKPKMEPLEARVPFDIKDPLTHRATKLVYVLSHKYTESSLAPAFLKNKDALVASSLSQFCRESGGLFELYLCKLKYHFEWRGQPESMYRGDDEELGEHETLEISVSLGTEWVACGSSANTSSIQVAGKDPARYWDHKFGDVYADWSSEVAPCQFFDDEELVFDSKDESMYTGNEGSLLEKWYMSAALVLVPVGQRVALQAIKQPAATWADVWLPMVDSKPAQAKSVALAMGASPMPWSLDTPEGSKVIEALSRQKDVETATAVLKSCAYIAFQPALRELALSFPWEQVAKMVADVVAGQVVQWQRKQSRLGDATEVAPRGAYAASAVNLIKSILRGEEDAASAIAAVLDASNLTNESIPFERESWHRDLDLPSAEEYAHVLRLTLRVSPAQFQRQLVTESPATARTMLSQVVSPAVRQVLDGHVPDALRDSVVKLRDALVVANAAALHEPYASMTMNCPFKHSADPFFGLLSGRFDHNFLRDRGPCERCKPVNAFLKEPSERSMIVSKSYLDDHKGTGNLTTTTVPDDATKMVITKSYEAPECARLCEEIAALETLLAPA